MYIDCGKILTFIFNLDWNNFLSTLAGAFVGAWSAYRFNLKRTEKQQKDIQKAKLLKLFYDINILNKVFVYHYVNTDAEINNLTESEIKPFIPITINNTNFNIDEYGFITQFSPLLYEILTYVHHDINYICEQQNIALKYLEKKMTANIYYDYSKKLNDIKQFSVKLITKLFVSLININNILVKHYKCENLIKDEIVNAYIRANKIIDRTISDYENILNDKESNNKYDEIDLDTIKEDLEYIKEILDFWVIDFGLNKKQKKIIKTEINEQFHKKWGAKGNDL